MTAKGLQLGSTQGGLKPGTQALLAEPPFHRSFLDSLNSALTSGDHGSARGRHQAAPPLTQTWLSPGSSPSLGFPSCTQGGLGRCTQRLAARASPELPGGGGGVPGRALCVQRVGWGMGNAGPAASLLSTQLPWGASNPERAPTCGPRAPALTCSPPHVMCKQWMRPSRPRALGTPSPTPA